MSEQIQIKKIRFVPRWTEIWSTYDKKWTHCCKPYMLWSCVEKAELYDYVYSYGFVGLLLHWDDDGHPCKIERPEMTEQEVIDLMKSSQTEQEWNANCSKITTHFDGYPSFWFRTIVLSGLIKEVAAYWGGDGEIHILGSSPDK